MWENKIKGDSGETINQDEYKSYVTSILFFKRLSDVYDEEHEYALRESGGDEEFTSFDENYSL